MRCRLHTCIPWLISLVPRPPQFFVLQFALTHHVLYWIELKPKTGEALGTRLGYCRVGLLHIYPRGAMAPQELIWRWHNKVLFTSSTKCVKGERQSKYDKILRSRILVREDRLYMLKTMQHAMKHNTRQRNRFKHKSNEFLQNSLNLMQKGGLFSSYLPSCSMP